MIPKDFQLGILARLQSDAYFTQGEAVDVREQKVGADAKIAVQDALKARGLIMLVGLPKFRRDYGKADNEFVFETAVEVFENPKINADVEAEDETGREGETCIWKAFALLHNYTVPIKNTAGEDVNPFSKLRIEDGGFLGEREGVPVFGLRILSRIYLDVLATCLANEDGFFLVTESGAPLLVSPTDP